MLNATDLDPDPAFMRSARTLGGKARHNWKQREAIASTLDLLRCGHRRSRLLAPHDAAWCLMVVAPAIDRSLDRYYA